MRSFLKTLWKTIPKKKRMLFKDFKRLIREGKIKFGVKKKEKAA